MILTEYVKSRTSLPDASQCCASQSIASGIPSHGGNGFPDSLKFSKVHHLPVAAPGAAQKAPELLLNQVAVNVLTLGCWTVTTTDGWFPVLPLDH